MQPALQKCVHMRLGAVEVVEKRSDRWAFRQPPSEFVEDREPNEFRPYLSKAEAASLLAVFRDPRPLRVSDAERREAVKKFRFDKMDLRKPMRIAKQLLYFAELVAGGQQLWTMEQIPCGYFRERMVGELAEVLGESRERVEARLPG